MKNVIRCLTASLLVLCVTGCHSESPQEKEASSEKLQIVTTIFPEYDWVREIIKGNEENIECTLLLDSGTDLHSFQPSAEDILKIADSDIFLYIGGESDQWVDDALAKSTNPDQIVLNMMSLLEDDLYLEEEKEGMQESHHHDHEDEHEEEYDEHIWLSLNNASFLCESICNALCEKDPTHEELYRANTAAYCDKLKQLDADYQVAVQSGSSDTLLFGDRFPFLYLVKDYNLDYYAAFSGCSAESEASFETIIFLSNKVNELDLSAICTIESSDGSIAKAVKDNTDKKDQEILVFDSMQSVKAADIEQGASYLSIMEKNLEVLKQALN